MKMAGRHFGYYRQSWPCFSVWRAYGWFTAAGAETERSTEKRLYLLNLEKIMKKPLHFAAVSGCAVFTFVLWWMYADQADYSMGEGAAAALLLLGVHGLFAALLAMLFTSPVFAEEYSCNMEGLLWTSVKGRKETAWCKAAAALTIALAVYISFLAADLIFVCCVWGAGNWYAAWDSRRQHGWIPHLR